MPATARNQNSPAAKRRLQMQDIARLAGVSASTVSRALNGSELISPETRQRIVELARKLNYSINQSAQSLRLGATRTLAVVIPYSQTARQGISDPFFLSMLGSLADALTEKNYDLLLSRVEADHLDDAAALYDTGRARGIIVIGQWGHHDQLNELASRGVPIAVWGAQLPRQLYATVGGDNYLGGQLAAEHLIAIGRKKIAFMGDVQLPEVEQRYQGFLNTLAQHQIKHDAKLMVPSAFTAQAAQSSFLNFLKNETKFDALFAASDFMAINAIGIMNSKGLNVPQDVSVIGYDDIELAAHSFPPLTTIRQPVEMAGAALLEVLEDVFAHKHASSRLLPATLVKRQSC